jgi:hypothetical protein
MTEDDISTAELAMHVERFHRAPAKHLESVEVKETFEGQTADRAAARALIPADRQAKRT